MLGDVTSMIHRKVAAATFEFTHGHSRASDPMEVEIVTILKNEPQMPQRKQKNKMVTE